MPRETDRIRRHPERARAQRSELDAVLDAPMAASNAPGAELTEIFLRQDGQTPSLPPALD